MDIKVDQHTVIVFDLDDTLYNELDYLISAYKSIAKFVEPTHWRPLFSKMLSLYRGQLNVFEFISKSYNVESELLIEMYRNHYPEIQLFDGVIEVFKAIKSNNGKIGIITDGRSRTQRAKLKSLAIMPFVDSVVISEEIGSEKPSLKNFEAIENTLSGMIYYYIADNLKKDFIAPNLLGWKSIAVIDNGKNIHYDSHFNMNADTLPQNFIVNFSELTIT